MNKTELLAQEKHLQDQLQETQDKLAEVDWSTIPENALIHAWDGSPPRKHESPDYFRGYHPGNPAPFLVPSDVYWQRAKPAPQQIIIHTGGDVCPLHPKQMVAVWYDLTGQPMGEADTFDWALVSAFRMVLYRRFQLTGVKLST